MDLQSVKQRFGIIGNSEGLNHALSTIMRVAPTNLSILITGESGVGKEIMAQVVHSISSLKHNPYIAVNCGAIPEGTIDSELFGHEKGAFTGAHEARKGYFEAVNGGTIFLDEISEMPLSTQARLLRILETGEFIKVGSSKVQKTEVRVVAATNVNLPQMIRDGKFREDLYYRLATVPINIPPLRERQEDIHLLFRKFSSDYAEKYKTQTVRLDEEAQEVLRSYPWYGNIRELKNIAEQVSVLSSESALTATDLKQYMPDSSTSTLPVVAKQGGESESSISEREIMYKVLIDMKKDLNDLKKVVYGNMNPEDVQGQVHSSDNEYIDIPPKSVEQEENKPIVISQPDQPVEDSIEDIDIEESLSIADKEKELITKALEKHKGKRKDAATDLGISERTLYRKIKEYGIDG